MTAETHNQLKKDVLSTWDVIAQALAFLGPVMSMSFLTAYIAMAAGSAVPLAVFLGGLTMVALGYVVAQFATRVHAAGAIYNYAAKAFGPEIGFMGGWVYLFAVLCLTIAIIAGVAGWTTEILAMLGMPLPAYSWLAVAVVECLALYLLAYFDVRISTRTQLWLVFGSVAIVVLLALYVLAIGGASGHSLTPFSFQAAGGLEGLTFGMIFAILMYTGFESAAVLAEETADPKRSMPIAIVGTVAAAVLLYVVVTYAYSIGFGFTGEGVAAWADPNSPALFSMAGMYVGDWLVVVVFLAAVVDGFAVALGCLNTSARVAFAIARDGALPTVLSHTHPRHKTPHIANGAVLGLSLLVALGFALVFPPVEGAPTAYTIEFGYLAGIGAITIEVIYVFVSIAAIVWFRRELRNEYSVLKHLVVPIVAVVGSSAALYGSFLPSLDAASDPLTRTMPYVALAWIVAGLLYIVFLRSTRPGLVAQIGRDLSALDMPEPVDVRFQHDTGGATD